MKVKAKISNLFNYRKSTPDLHSRNMFSFNLHLLERDFKSQNSMGLVKRP